MTLSDLSEVKVKVDSIGGQLDDGKGRKTASSKDGTTEFTCDRSDGCGRKATAALRRSLSVLRRGKMDEMSGSGDEPGSTDTQLEGC